MMHLTIDEIFELASKFSTEEIMNVEEIEKLQHIKECKECYEKLGIAVALCDATMPKGLSLVAELRQHTESTFEEITENISVIKVVRQKINDIKTAVMEQLDVKRAILYFEPAIAVATRGDETNVISSMVKLEELDDEKTFIAFDAKRNELYIQVNVKNLQSNKIGVYLLCENKKIIEVPVILERGLIKGRVNNIPDGDFKIYIDAE